MQSGGLAAILICRGRMLFAHPGEDGVLRRVRPHGVKVLVLLLPDGHDHVGEGGLQSLHFHCGEIERSTVVVAQSTQDIDGCKKEGCWPRLDFRIRGKECVLLWKGVGFPWFYANL